MNFSEVDAYKARHAAVYLRRKLDAREGELRAFLRRLGRRNQQHSTLASRNEEEQAEEELVTIGWARELLIPSRPVSPSASAASSARGTATARAARR